MLTTYFSADITKGGASDGKAMYTIESQSGCFCEKNDKTGVIPVKLTAKENLELWAACNDKPDSAYEFGCNHFLLAEGDTLRIPTDPLGVYDKANPIHAHIRARSNSPHAPRTNVEWEHVDLKPCACGSATSATSASQATP